LENRWGIFFGIRANLVNQLPKIDVLQETAKEMRLARRREGNSYRCDVRDIVVRRCGKKQKLHLENPCGVLNNAAGNFISPTERFQRMLYLSWTLYLKVLLSDF